MRNLGALALWGLAIGSSLVVGPVVAARTSLPPAVPSSSQMMEEMGGKRGGVYEDENNLGLVSTISEWDSHDQMHAASDKYGDQFNEEAGTTGLEWTTHIWQKKGDA